jgi:hypothetical protein
MRVDNTWAEKKERAFQAPSAKIVLSFFLLY